MRRLFRVTYETLRAGQPKPYADTEHVCRMLIETTDDQGMFIPLGRDVPSVVLTPEGWTFISPNAFLQNARAYSNWQELDPTKSDMENHFRTSLDYIRLVGPGLIEWRTVTPFTD